MRVPRIYTHQHLDSFLNSEKELSLDANATHHVLTVLRMSVGRSLILFNGNGLDYKATICAAGKRNVQVNIIECVDVQNESALHCHLAIGVSRGDRFDHVLQKATELGVNEITPLMTERTGIKLSAEKLDKKHASWQKIVVGACEQSGRACVPILHSPCSLLGFIKAPRSGVKILLHHKSNATLNDKPTPTSVILVVGPEGGLSPDEISLSAENHYQSMRMGPRVLRTETAPIAALSILQYTWGDMR